MRIIAALTGLFAIFAVAGLPAPATYADVRWPILENGGDGPDVCTVQYLLRGYTFPGKPDLAATCEFDDATELAVRAFQRSRGLLESGKADTAVWESIKRDIARRPIHGGHRNAEHVKAVQTQLNKHGAKLKVDGVYGRLTTAAVNRFQKSHKLEVDGVTGWITFQALLTSASG